MKNKLYWHQITLIIVFGLLTTIRLLNKSQVFDLNLLWWWVGGIVGFFFVFLDRFINVFLTQANTDLSVRVKNLYGDKRWSEMFLLLFNERESQENLAMRSVVFVAIWIVLGLFTMASVPAGFARGLVLGIGTHLIFDMTADLRYDLDKFEKWFWQIKRNVAMMEKRWFWLIFLLSYLYLAFWL